MGAGRLVCEAVAIVVMVTLARQGVERERRRRGKYVEGEGEISQSKKVISGD